MAAPDRLTTILSTKGQHIPPSPPAAVYGMLPPPARPRTIDEMNAGIAAEAHLPVATS